MLLAEWEEEKLTGDMWGLGKNSTFFSHRLRALGCPEMLNCTLHSLMEAAEVTHSLLGTCASPAMPDDVGYF